MTKIWRVWLKHWVCYALLNFKIKMGVAGSTFELHPPNFVKIHIFWISTNDSKTIFCWLCWHRICWHRIIVHTTQFQSNLSYLSGFSHRLLYTWTEDWIIFFTNSMLAQSAKYRFTIICRYSNYMNFHKIWRV